MCKIGQVHSIRDLKYGHVTHVHFLSERARPHHFAFFLAFSSHLHQLCKYLFGQSESLNFCLDFAHYQQIFYDGEEKTLSAHKTQTLAETAKAAVNLFGLGDKFSAGNYRLRNYSSYNELPTDVCCLFSANLRVFADIITDLHWKGAQDFG